MPCVDRRDFTEGGTSGVCVEARLVDVELAVGRVVEVGSCSGVLLVDIDAFDIEGRGGVSDV